MGDNSGDKARATSTRTAAGRRWIFAYDVAALVAVMAIGAYYVVAQPSLGAATANQVLAIESMWFGAIGGLMISLKGVYDHRDGASGWDSGFALWHIGRPFSGAVAGAVTALLLSVVDGGKTAAPTVVYAAAFIFGTQERRFFGFLSKLPAWSCRSLTKPSRAGWRRPTFSLRRRRRARWSSSGGMAWPPTQPSSSARRRSTS